MRSSAVQQRCRFACCFYCVFHIEVFLPMYSAVSFCNAEIPFKDNQVQMIFPAHFSLVFEFYNVYCSKEFKIAAGNALNCQSNFLAAEGVQSMWLLVLWMVLCRFVIATPFLLFTWELLLINFSAICLHFTLTTKIVVFRCSFLLGSPQSPNYPCSYLSFQPKYGT